MGNDIISDNKYITPKLLYVVTVSLTQMFCLGSWRSQDCRNSSKNILNIALLAWYLMTFPQCLLINMILNRWHVSELSYRKWHITSVWHFRDPCCETWLNTVAFYMIYICDWCWQNCFWSTTPPKSQVNLLDVCFWQTKEYVYLSIHSIKLNISLFGVITVLYDHFCIFLTVQTQFVAKGRYFFISVYWIFIGSKAKKVYL